MPSSVSPVDAPPFFFFLRVADPDPEPRWDPLGRGVPWPCPSNPCGAHPSLHTRLWVDRVASVHGVLKCGGKELISGAVRHDRIGELRVSNSPCSPDEWESILKSLLVKHEPIEGIEAGAETQAGKTITITVRRRVAGINVSAPLSLTSWFSHVIESPSSSN